MVPGLRPARQPRTTFPRELRVGGVAEVYGPLLRRVLGVQRDAMAAWAERLAGVRGVLLDISGVLYDSGAGGGTAIAGSVEAVARLVGSTQGRLPAVPLPSRPPLCPLAPPLRLARNQMWKVGLGLGFQGLVGSVLWKQMSC